MEFEWDMEKNRWLQEERGVSFEEIVERIESGAVIAFMAHPNKQRYRHQKMIKVVLNEYVYCVPCVEKKNAYFLKTIIPSRKATKEYIQERKAHEDQAG